MWRRRYYRYYQESQPRETKAGIKAQSKRGKFGESWWAKRWIGIIESFHIGARLDRGKSYARRGQVTSIEVQKGAVTAQVQGSRARPYHVEIRVKTLTDTQWDLVGQRLSKTALFAARLLAGEMPETIEDVFRAAQVPLFPTRSSDIKTECSCPDWSNPCKHIAAVHYLLGEEFDRDPFLIFKLRGLERDDMMSLIGRYSREHPEPVDTEIPAEAERAPFDAPEPLPEDPLLFWGAPLKPDEWEGEVEIPAMAAPLVRRLGAFPFWRGQERFLDAVESVMQESSQTGLQVFLGEWRRMPRKK